MAFDLSIASCLQITKWHFWQNKSLDAKLKESAVMMTLKVVQALIVATTLLIGKWMRG